MDGLIEAHIFNGRSDDGTASGGASCTRDDIDVGSANDQVQGKRSRQENGKHLALLWRYRQIRLERSGGSPSSCTGDELCSMGCAVGTSDLNCVVDGASREDASIWLDVDGCGADGDEKGCGELTGVEAMLIEAYESMVAGSKSRKEMSEIFAAEFSVCNGGASRNGLQGSVSLKGDVDAGEFVYAVEVVGV